MDKSLNGALERVSLTVGHVASGTVMSRVHKCRAIITVLEARVKGSGDVARDLRFSESIEACARRAMLFCTRNRRATVVRSGSSILESWG